MASLELLRTVKACESMSDEQIMSIQKFCEEKEYRKGDKLFSEGDIADHLWYVLDGQVDLRFELPDKRSTHPERTVTSIEVKEVEPEAKVLGWSCFVPPYRMRLSAFCVTDRVKILRIYKNDLQGCFDDDPLMGYRFLSYLITVVGYRFHQFQDHVATNMGEDLMNGW